MSEREARIQKLHGFIEKAPGNPLPRYMLALEHKSAGEHDLAVAAFSALVERSPDYVPTYLIYGSLLTELGRTEAARDVLQRGLDAARAKGDAHALSELQGALGQLD